MVKRDGDDVVQLLIDTGVLAPADGDAIQSVQTEVIMQHMRNKGVLSPSEEPAARQVLAVLLGSSPPTQRLQAKVQLVGIITNNVHLKIERQGVKTREQRERITGETFPMVARLAKSK